MIVEEAIEALQTDFVRSPANYRVESELAFDLKRRINSVLPPAEITGEHNDGTSRNGPDHSEYADAILSSVRFDRAHCEVSGSDFGLSKRKLLDLVVFGSEVEIELDDGVKRFQESDVDVAIEIKYRKDLHYLRESSPKHAKHLEEVERLTEAFSEDTDLYYLLFSNYGLLRQQTGKAALEELKNHRDRVNISYTCPDIS
jgi:hypothetical protein